MENNYSKLINEMISNSMIKMEDTTMDICRTQHYSNISTHIILPDDFEKEDGMQIFIHNKHKQICELLNYEIVDVTNNNDEIIKMLVVDEMFIGQDLVIYYIANVKCKCCTINSNNINSPTLCVDIDSNGAMTITKE